MTDPKPTAEERAERIVTEGLIGVATHQFGRIFAQVFKEEVLQEIRAAERAAKAEGFRAGVEAAAALVDEADHWENVFGLYDAIRALEPPEETA